MRPAFTLRVVNRFQKVAGFDRSMALASSALTALIPLAVLGGALLDLVGDHDVADEIIDHYGLTGGGAQAVTDLFASTADEAASTGAGIAGTVFVVISVLGFSRAAQRVFEQAWELKPLSVRNTLNGLWWIACSAAFLALNGWISASLDQRRLGLASAACQAVLSVGFFVLSGRILSAKRLSRTELLPFGVLAAVLAACYSVGASIYLPHLFDSYATAYGAVGAVFALISALFGAMLVVVGSVALGREVHDELGRIRAGRRPADDEVRREWDAVLDEMRSRWRTARRQLSPRRDRDPPPG
ncbi:YihY/virulence factor BrkB family protein [Streptomyces subrutilus]|uniref:YihY/virulence factor BrkB family protein n=1 Tax=Streptomyces subrutilus TaxID=36818 RepID=UPI00227D8178|nr:YhjD/YihY/BrkB family envelope integrity protein [Streptomyces subrutilus]WSJ34007.1 YihY/virulence factor BrkB family protein [Streptomyces subrutilus]